MSQERHTDDVQNSAETSFGGINRRTYIKGAIAAGALAFGPSTAAADSHEEEGGPVVLMGVDPELGGDTTEHGSIESYATLVEEGILAEVTNGGNGMLVIGEEDDTTDVNAFWNAIANSVGKDITYVGGADDIEQVSFDSYAMLGIISNEAELAPVQEEGPGLSNDENNALTDRAQDIADFINDGGGLLGFTQASRNPQLVFDSPWGYMGGIGNFETETGLCYHTIDPTDEGEALDLTTPEFNFSCWHDVFTEYPDWLDVLAYAGEGEYEGEAAALGGSQVVVDVEPTPEECVDLIAHKSADPVDGDYGDIGEVCVDDDGDQITVRYDTDNDWELRRTFVEVAADLDDTNATEDSGAAIPSAFGYRKHHDPTVDSATHEIGFEDLDADPGDTLEVAATAHVVCTVGDSETQHAWGDGERFVNEETPTHFRYQSGEEEVDGDDNNGDDNDNDDDE